MMLLTEEQEQVRDIAREFAQRSLLPHSAEWDSQAVFPQEALRELGRLGFMGMTVPLEWDGAGSITLHMRLRWRKLRPATARSRQS
jgi:alkylation response protein AidB-like acyl-CoA dehydrogenase